MSFLSNLLHPTAAQSPAAYQPGGTTIPIGSTYNPPSDPNINAFNVGSIIPGLNSVATIGKDVSAVIHSDAGSAILAKLSGKPTTNQIHRAQEVQGYYMQAAAGDADALAWLKLTQTDKEPSGKWVHTKDTREMAAQALQALRTGVVFKADPTKSVDQISAELGKLVAHVESDVAHTVGNIGSGATAAAANAIDPNNTRIVVPFDTQTLLLIGGAAVVLFFVLRRK